MTMEGDMKVVCECGKQYQVSDDAAGKRVRCKACGAAMRLEEQYDTLEVLEPEATAPTAVAAPQPYAVAAPLKATGRSGKQTARQVESLGSFKKRYRDPGQAIAQFARSRSMEYSVHKLDDRCQCCGRQGAFNAYEIVWRGQVSKVRVSPLSILTVFLGGLVLRRELETVMFQTYHTICGVCLLTHRLLRLVGLLGYLACVILIFVAVFMALFNLVDLNDPKQHASWNIIKWSIVCVAALAGVVLFPRLKAPVALWRVGPLPFYRKSMVRI